MLEITYAYVRCLTYARQVSYFTKSFCRTFLGPVPLKSTVEVFIKLLGYTPPAPQKMCSANSCEQNQHTHVSHCELWKFGFYIVERRDILIYDKYMENLEHMGGK